MSRSALVCVVLAIAAVATACGGGSSGSVTYAPTVVPIKHIDLTGVDLASVNVTKLPQSLLDQYPAVLASVNGQPISNSSVILREISAIGERAGQAIIYEHSGLPTPAAPEEDPVESAIDSSLNSKRSRN